MTHTLGTLENARNRVKIVAIQHYRLTDVDTKLAQRHRVVFLVCSHSIKQTWGNLGISA